MVDRTLSALAELFFLVLIVPRARRRGGGPKDRALIAGAMLLFCSSSLAADYLGVQNRVTELFREHQSAIVRVKAAYAPVREGDRAEVVAGSGFFISRDGHVLTNASGVSGADRTWIEHGGVAFAAQLVGADAASNLALLKAETLPSRFSYLPLADAADMPLVGSMIIRISAPLEFEPSPSLGLVSGRESRLWQNLFPCTYVRTTIPDGPGAGGGAYLDLNGRLVGIQVASIPDLGETYVLPSRAALRIRDDLLFSGKVSYGWLGFEVRPEGTVRSGRRIVLSIVFPDTPADEVGLQAGDVLVQIGDHAVSTVDDLRNAIFHARVGQFVRARVIRGEAEMEFNVRLVARPESEPLQVPLQPGVIGGVDRESEDTGSIEPSNHDVGPLLPENLPAVEISGSEAPGRTNVP